MSLPDLEQFRLEYSFNRDGIKLWLGAGAMTGEGSRDSRGNDTSTLTGIDGPNLMTGAIALLGGLFIGHAIRPSTYDDDAEVAPRAVE